MATIKKHKKQKNVEIVHKCLMLVQKIYFLKKSIWIMKIHYLTSRIEVPLMGVALQQWTFKKIICKRQSGDKSNTRDKNHVAIVHFLTLIQENIHFR
jgi:hypothetical protein